MKREDVLPLAKKVCAALQPLCERVCIAGSIRRLKPEVNDVDIVAMPKSVDHLSPLGFPTHFTEPWVWSQLIPQTLTKGELKLKSLEAGQELLRFSFRNSELQVDIYRARPETWGVILLVRTGSREHNVKLCTLARSKGLMLSASQGVIEVKETGLRPTIGEPCIIASRTEEEIFNALGLAFVEPKDREVVGFA